jgi:hypothetical protein
MITTLGIGSRIIRACSSSGAHLGQFGPNTTEIDRAGSTTFGRMTAAGQRFAANADREDSGLAGSTRKPDQTRILRWIVLS